MNQTLKTSMTSKGRNAFRTVQLLAMVLWVSAAQGVTLLPTDNSAIVDQVDFRAAPDSSLGQLTIDIANANAAAGLSSGYINVADSSGNWLVRNLPIFGSATFDSPTITANFNLDVPDGTALSSKNLCIDYSSTPTTSFGGGSTALFSVGQATLAQGGFGGSLSGYLGTNNPSQIQFNTGELISGVYQKNHPNQQAANNQCAPMAVANSLTWLKNEKGLPVPDPNNIGLKGDNSLVGKLDSAMKRGVRTRTDGDPVAAASILDGKLTYVGDANLGDKVITKHQGMLGGADVKGANGLLSHARGTAISIDWIISELEHGEDVEMGFVYPGGGGHFVDITGAGYILGVPWITYVSDHSQTDKDPTDTSGTGMVDFSFLKGNTLVMEPGTPSMAFVISQSIPEPSTFTFAVLGVGAIWLTGHRRRQGKSVGLDNSLPHHG
jgi:hypothetical protein